MTTSPLASVLLSSERWSEYQALAIIQGNLATFMGKLNTAEQRDYLRLCKQHNERETALGQALDRFNRDLDQQMAQALQSALTLKAGQPLDPRTIYLKTRIRQVPVPPQDLPDIAPDDSLAKRWPVFKEDLSVQEYERSLTLLEAAHRNFGFTAYFSTEEQNASFLTDSALSVNDFVAVARQVDIGKRVGQFIEEHFANRLSLPLYALHSNKLHVALYDAYRTEATWGIGEQAFNRLRLQVSDSSIQWDTYQIDAGGEKIALPFFTRRFETADGPQVYSYFPDRPEGAFRRHFSLSEAVDELQHQLRNEVGLKGFEWFIKAISLNNQEKLRVFIKPLTVNRDKLNWHARILHDLFANSTPNRQKLRIEKFGVSSRSLVHSLPISLSWPIQSDLTRLARTTRLADREAALALLAYVASETLSMLLIPVPGGVTGLSKVMLLATFGTLGVQSLEAVSALRRGRQAEMIQALGDIFDLLTSARIQGVAARLSSQRTRQLMRTLGEPKAASQAGGTPGLWFMQAYTQVDPTPLAAVEPNAQGVLEHGGQRYIRLVVDGQEKVAKVILDPASGRYQLTHEGATVQPFVTYRAQHKRWVLDPIDTRPLSDSQLLQQILSASHLPLTLNACQRALDVAGVDRQHLLDIWTGQATAHWRFDQAIEEQHLRGQLSLLQKQLKTPDAALPPLAEHVLPALMADLCRSSISLYKADGVTLGVRHEPLLAANERAMLPIELVLTDDGRVRTRALASTAAPLINQVLQEYERLNPNSTLGKTGRNAHDQHVENRVHALRKALGQHLGEHLYAVFQAVLEQQSRGHLSPASPAYRFAPASNAIEPSVAITLRRRFPELSRIAAAQLARQQPTLLAGDYSPIDAPARTAISEHQLQSRVTRALGAMSDPAGIGLDAHSVALFCHLLPLLPAWPDKLAIQVYQATYDHAGRVSGRGLLLDTYGDAQADTFVMLVKDGHQYASYLQDSDQVQLPPSGENSLVSATLRSLTDAQRDALGRDIHDRDGLIEDALHQAQVHRAYLQDFLAPARHLPLSSQTLSRFRAFDLHQNSRQPDADGILAFNGRRYVNVDEVAYQVMLDRDASGAEGKVWRIVNPKDPVAVDSENIYHASRSGETHAITRNAAMLWVTARVGALGGMRRSGHMHDTKAYLLQRYQPIQAVFQTLGTSGLRFDALLAEAKKHPADSEAEQIALVALEVHTLKHTRLLESYVNSLIEHKDWLVLLKAGGLYKQELLEQQKIRVDFLNKLMAIMDLRVRPTILKEITVETCKKNLAHMNKKLEFLQQRREVVEQIRKLSRSDGEEMDRINSALPDENKVHVTRFNVLNRLLGDDPTAPPTIGLNTAMAIHWVVDDLPNIPERFQPVALRLALEQIAVEKPDYAALLGTASSERATSVSGILAIIDIYETQIEHRITQLHEKLASNQELPAYDQDIDFDFIPPQPAGSTEPVQPKKMFRMRRNGGYKVMVGIKETAPDGTVTVKVDDPFKLDAPRRYEKKAGEWQPVSVATTPAAKPLLLTEADALLSRVDEHVAQARANEAKKHYPTNIYEFLGTKADQLSALAQKLESAGADSEAAARVAQLKAGSERLMVEGRNILVRMYKNKEVLNVQRLDYLLDQAQLNVVRTLTRRQLGKGKERSYLDVYSINDALDNRPLWEAHFHYDKPERPDLDYMTKGGHLKTLAQSRQGSGFQQREEQAGRAHQAIWREAISPKVAQKLFDRVQ